jgi:hypothetical protein
MVFMSRAQASPCTFIQTGLNFHVPEHTNDFVEIFNGIKQKLQEPARSEGDDEEMRNISKLIESQYTVRAPSVAALPH